MSMNTVGIAWLVVRQFRKEGERFAFEGEARTYAAKLAARLPDEKIEVFACVSNVFAEIPVTTVSSPSAAESAK